MKILGTIAGHHRPGRGPRPLPQDDGQAGHPHARIRHGQQPRARRCDDRRRASAIR
ncbi:MAG: hypothetical protein MZV70_72480 [Desulfobacterales bacterium]|nr:hypothetical protein [Desulfobacterales bacterium]